MKRFPPRKEIESALKDIEADPGSSVLPPGASAKARLKFQLCEAIVVYFKRKRLTQRQLAEQLKVDEAKVSKVLHYKAVEFTIDRLINYAETLGIKYELKLIV